MTFATEHFLAPIAGSLDGDYGHVDGSARSARFHQPLDIAVDQDDEFLYVADYGNFAVRKVNLDTLEVSTLTDNLPGSPVRLVVADNMIFVSCIAPVNDNWTPPLPYSEDELDDLGPDPVWDLSNPIIDAHIQAEFDADVRWPAWDGTATAPNAHPGPRQMLCFFPEGDLVWMRAHGNFNYDESFFAHGVDGAFVLPGGSGIDDREAKTGHIPGWKLRSNNSGQTYGADGIHNFIPRFGEMDGIYGYVDAAYTRPDVARNHCYCGAGSLGCDCYPYEWPDHDYHHRADGDWTCTRWGDGPFLGNWNSGTSYNHLEAVGKAGDPDTWTWYGIAEMSTAGIEPTDVDPAGSWVETSVTGFDPDEWESIVSYFDGHVVVFEGTEYYWEGDHRTSTAGQEPGVDTDVRGTWYMDCRCAVLPVDLHYSSEPGDLTHSWWQDMSADMDWCDAYNDGFKWVAYNSTYCVDEPAFREPGKKPPCDPDPPCDSGSFTYSEGNSDQDGPYADDVGLLVGADGFHVGYLSYVYPSNTGLTTQIKLLDTFCGCVEDGTPPEDYILRSAYRHWGSSLSESSVEWDREYLTRNWDGNAAWQMAWGPYDELDRPVIGSAMYNSGDGILQTFSYDEDDHTVTNVTHWGEINPPHNTTGPPNGDGTPCRGIAYSPSRDTWYFSSSATSTYGPYTKFEAGSRNDVGYHQILRMVPYNELHPTGNMHLGGINGSYTHETLKTTASGIVWNDLNRDGIYNDGEPLLEGIDIISYDINDNVRDTATTDVDGAFTVEMSYPIGRIEIDSSTWPEGLTEQIPPYRLITVDALQDNEANFSLREPRVSDVLPSAGSFLPLRV